MISNLKLQDVLMGLETFECGLNVLGYIPAILGDKVSRLRSLYAKIELVAGGIFTVYAAGLWAQGHSHHFYLALGGVLMGQACLNLFRSCLEFCPGLPLVTTLPYDLITTRLWGERLFSYV